jgi:hypothetical protein
MIAYKFNNKYLISQYLSFKSHILIHGIIKKFSSNNRRVVVTGMGCVCPLGLNKTQSYENLKNFKSGIQDLKNESYATHLPNSCKIGAPIPKEFNPSKYKTLVRRQNLFS